MKKNILLVIIALALVFSSCSDREEIDLKYQVNVTVDPSTVLSAFEGISIGGTTYGLDMYDNSELLITSLIYDNSGNLVEKIESRVKDYNNSAQFSISMKEGEEYTVVAIAYSVLPILSIDAYEIENENRLDKLTITPHFHNGNSFYSNWSMLGIATKTINSTNKENLIYVKPASSMVELYFHDIHALPDQLIDSLNVNEHYIAYSNNDQANFLNGNLGYVSQLGSGAGWVCSLNVNDYPGANNISIIMNLLPTSEMHVWAGVDLKDGTNIHYSTLLESLQIDPSLGKGVIDIEPGEEYSFTIDCGELSISLGYLNKSATDLQSSQSDKLSEKFVEYKQYVPNVITPQQTVNVMELIKSMK